MGNAVEMAEDVEDAAPINPDELMLVLDVLADSKGSGLAEVVCTEGTVLVVLASSDEEEVCVDVTEERMLVAVVEGRIKGVCVAVTVSVLPAQT